MQRKPMIGTHPNPHSLQTLPADKKLWQDKDIQDIRKLLWDALIVKGAHLALPEHDDLHALLTVINDRLQECVTNDVVKNSQLSEDFLQVSAIINFYLGNYAEAAQFAGVLGDTYFLRAPQDADVPSSHFNQIAALAYQEMDQAEEACHYFNQYLNDKIGPSHRPADVQAAAAYLLQNGMLMCTPSLLRVLQIMANGCGEDKQLSASLMRQIDRAECLSIYEDLDRRKIQTHLQELQVVVRAHLQKMADTASPKTAALGLFAKKTDVDADVSVAEVPRFK